MKHVVFILLILGIIPVFVLGQNRSSIVVDKQYYGSIDQVLDRISFDKGVLFTYNKKKLADYKVDDNTVNQPLSKLLDKWCLELKMEWYIDESNIINIVGKNRTPEMTSKNIETKKTYFGKPQHFNILISGKITDASTGEAIPFASVYIRGSNKGAQANQDGIYTLQNIPTDTTTITLSSVGYKTGYIYLDPDMDKSKLDVRMSPLSVEVEQVEVTAQRNSIVRNNDKVSTIQMTPRKLAELPNIGERDILRSLQLMPGVSAANEGSSGLYVRGGTPDQNLILYDGFTVYHVDHLYGFFSAFNPNAVKDVQLYKGGFESKFAGRLSSVTEITGKDGNSKGLNYGGDLSLLSANVFAEVPIGKKFTSLFAFRKSYQGPIYDKIFKQYNSASDRVAVQRPGGGMGGPGRGFNNNFAAQVSSYFYDLNTKMTYRPSDKDAVSFSLFNGTDNLDNGMKLDMPDFMRDAGRSFSSDNTDLTEYGNLGASLKWSRRWNSKLYGSTLFSYSNYYSNRDRSNNRTMTDSIGNIETFKMGTIENNDLRDYSFKSDYTYDISEKNQLGFGVQLTQYDIDYSYSQNDTSVILDISSKGKLMGGYLQSKLKFLDHHLTLTPGIHATYYEVTGKTYAEPRLSASYDMNDKLKIVGAWGQYYQFANRITREDILSGSRDFWILSDEDKIPVSKATHYIIGTNYDTKEYLFSIEAYYKQLSGLSEYSLRFNPRPGQRGVNYEQNFYTGKGYAQGIELLAQKKYGNLTGWVSYTLAQARNQFDVYGEDYFPASQDVTNEFKAISIYRWRNWSFSGTWIYTTGRPYTAPEGGYKVTLLDGTEKTYISAGIKNSRRLADYHRLDLAVNYFIKSRDRQTDRGSVSFSLFNVYDRNNIWYKEYQIVEDEIISIDKEFLGITPNLTLTLKLK
jgi:hypothetical protein